MQRGRGRRLDNDQPKLEPIGVKARWVADSDSDSETTTTSSSSMVTQIQSVKSSVSMGTFLQRFNDRDDNTSDISAIVGRRQPPLKLPTIRGNKKSADLKPHQFDIDAIYQVIYLEVICNVLIKRSNRKCQLG